jgi:hypothetical protein
MDEHQPYDPEVYKRLELVRQQFKRHTADQKAEHAAEKRRALTGWLSGHQQEIVRWAVYVFMAVLVLAVLGVIIANR